MKHTTFRTEKQNKKAGSSSFIKSLPSFTLLFGLVLSIVVAIDVGTPVKIIDQFDVLIKILWIANMISLIIAIMVLRSIRRIVTILGLIISTLLFRFFFPF